MPRIIGPAFPYLIVPRGYVGPGDFVGGSQGWYGLRAYSSARIGSNAIRLLRDSDNAQSDFVTVASGLVDVAAIATFKTGAGAANLFFVKIYDQTGNGNDLTCAGGGANIPFTLNGFGTFPIIVGDGVHSFTAAVGTSPTTTTTLTLTATALHTAGTVPCAIIGDNTGPSAEVLLQWDSANTVVWRQGNVGQDATITASDGSWHSFVANCIGSALTVNVDGAAEATGTGNGVDHLANTGLGLMQRGSSQQRMLLGSSFEFGTWPAAGDFSLQATRNAMAANMKAFLGF